MSTQIIGKPQDRVDGRLKVTGRAMYSGDRQEENLTYGYLLTSKVAKGLIQAMDTSVAERSPGVAAVYTPFNPLKLYHGLEPPEGATSGETLPPLQDQKILNYGQIIGLVVAESYEQARDAAALVRTQYQAEEPVASWEQGIEHTFTPESVDREKATVKILAEGVDSIDDAIRGSPLVVDVTYTEPIYHHNPMEPHATTAVWHGDRLTIYDATQGVISHRLNVASVLGIDEDMVRVLCPFVGGAFGCKGSMWMFSPLTAAAARALNRPVKTILTREQMFTLVGHRPALIQHLTLGANPDGTLQAVKHDVRSTVSFAKIFVEAAAHRTSRLLYKSPNIQVSHTLVRWNVGGPTFMRAPGCAPGMFSLECAMDELAVRCGIDPVELRTKNDAEVYPGRNVPWSCKNLVECYQLGAEKFGWSKRNSIPGAVQEGDWLVGMGMASALYPAHRNRASAKVRFQADGTAQVSSATQDLGTGTWTVLAMVGADSLGLPIAKIHTELGDSALPSAPTSGGSASVASVTPAIQKAAESAKKKLIQLAIRDRKSPFFGAKIEDVSYRNGELTGAGKSADFGSVLSGIGRSAVEAVEMAAAGEEEEKYAFHSFGAQFCQVKVNRWTGEVRLQRMTSVMDIGTVVNLKTARSQIMGGIVFGIGMALMEGTILEEKTGRYANANFADYLIATNADVPYIDIHFINKPDTIFNPLGARGIGEIGITGTPAAIANAVYNATGRRVREFPILPEKLLPIGANQPMISMSERS
ncbi:MAG: xanthine dehydrogenase family protein molybdopterin-binding subunit [Verrucomicrobia bacterium]|nr:xanthine dehydrogenase family protein molybdopterin-binding subunit [Verrucomicrobiota bacterium]